MVLICKTLNRGGGERFTVGKLSINSLYFSNKETTKEHSYVGGNEVNSIQDDKLIKEDFHKY